MKCDRCGQERPDNVDPILGRAWDLLHCKYPIMSWQELKAAANEFSRSGDLVKAAIAAALGETKCVNG